ncbi:ubiquitin-related domain-containing protein [Earliella scabrosa]|nr:ubiquitin-related domain-containing protein [Earliella scabrosa]
MQVVTQTNEEVFFKIKRNTKLSKLQGAYANKVGKDVSSIRFLYDGERISDDDTPASLGMEDNDTIDVMVEQVGGSA